jgi:molecular chaperone DnaK
LDVTPLALGIESMGGVFTTLIEANTTVPVKKQQVFTTAADGQTAVTIRIAQGDRPIFNDNKLLGQFNLDGIPYARRGVPQIEVTIDIDANSLVTVSAKDLGTGKEQHITIQNSNLSKEELERMKAEAAKYAEEDKRKAEEINTLNSADSYAFNIEKTLEEMKEKISDDERNTIMPKIEALKKAVEQRDVNLVKTCRNELGATWEPIIAKVYQANSGNNGQAGQGAGFDFMDMFKNAQNMYGNTAGQPEQPQQNPNENVSDADFEEVN